MPPAHDLLGGSTVVHLFPSMRVAVVSGAALRSLVVLGTRQSRGKGLAFLTGMYSMCMNCCSS